MANSGQSGGFARRDASMLTCKFYNPRWQFLRHALRTETTINNTRDFGIGKLVHNLQVLRQVGFAANRRLLEVERTSHDCALGEDAFQEFQQSCQIDGQRVPVLRFADPKVQALLHALLMFVFLAQGFTNKDLRPAFAVLLGKRSADISPGRMSYELRRQRLHGLIERLPKTHHCRLTKLGLRTAMFYTRVYSRVLRLGLAVVNPAAVPADSSPLQRTFRGTEHAKNDWRDNAKIAA